MYPAAGVKSTVYGVTLLRHSELVIQILCGVYKIRACVKVEALLIVRSFPAVSLSVAVSR